MVFLQKFSSTSRFVFQQSTKIWKGIIPKRTSRTFATYPVRNELTSYDSEPVVKEIRNIDHETLQVTFNDHVVTDFKNIWLRDSCQCEECVHPATRQKLVNIRDLDIDAHLSSVSIESSPTLSALKILWKERGREHCSIYPAKWLYQFSEAFDKSGCRERVSNVEYASVLPPQQLWDKELIESTMVEVSYDDYMNQQHGLFTLLSYLNAYGIAIIKDVPLEMKQVLKVAERISFVKQTTYGQTFQVINNPDPKTHLSYTGRRFELHTDLSYMQNAPSVQLLHCLEAANPESAGTDAGGISFFADAHHCATWLRQKHPDYFNVLSQTKLLFTFQDAERGRWFRMERPLIEANQNGDIIETYWSDFSMRPPLIPFEQIVPFYRAYRCLADKLNEDSSLWQFFLKPGDLVIFNNKRILHGRDTYDASKVKRHLEGCYLDFQEAMSLFESLLTSDPTKRSSISQRKST